MFIVAIRPLMFSPRDDTSVFKSMRLAGVFLYPLNDMVDGPGALFGLVGEERWTAALVPLAELGEDNVEEPGPV